MSLRNDDNVRLNNYHYTVTNSAGKVVATDVVDGEQFTIRDLDPNQIFIFNIIHRSCNNIDIFAYFAFSSKRP